MQKSKEDSCSDKAQIWSTHMKAEMTEVLTDAHMPSEEFDEENGLFM